MALFRITRSGDVPKAYKDEAAAEWDVWDSKGDPKRFPYSYPIEERVLLIVGSATLTPDDTDYAPFTVHAGDAVTFLPGFSCKWNVLKRTKKFFQYFDAAGKMCGPPAPPHLKCDAPDCKKNCFAESYRPVGTKLNICPKCRKKARGAEKRSYVGAVLMRDGATVVVQDENGEKEEMKKDNKRKAKSKPASRRKKGAKTK